MFFENIGAIKRGEKFRKTYDGYYMIPTGENGINNTIVITDGDYIKPSIESVIKINIDNETELSNVRAVSYTHLDVYKRQTQNRKRLVGFIVLTEE